MKFALGDRERYVFSSYSGLDNIFFEKGGFKIQQLIEELKLDHAELSDLFRKIVHLGITSEEGRKTLNDAKAILLAHLKKEDDELYPVLCETAKDNQKLKLKLESLANDLGNVTKTISAFLENTQMASMKPISKLTSRKYTWF